MNAEIVLQLSPEEEELAKKREELAILQVELADRELFLANLRAELAAFDGRYLREVGVLYAELDEWNARLAAEPDDLGTQAGSLSSAPGRSSLAETGNG